MMDFAAFLKKLRLARGHQSASALSNYAKTKGYTLTGQAIRNFEQGRVPNQESRRILSDILHMTPPNAEKFEYMCCYASMNRDWDSLDFLLVTPLNRANIVNQINRICGELTTDQREEVIQCLTSPNSIVRQFT